jgi:hypothetical protein
MRFGPDAFYIDRPTDPWAAPDYTVYEYHLDDAHKAITKYAKPATTHDTHDTHDTRHTHTHTRVSFFLLCGL